MTWRVHAAGPQRTASSGLKDPRALPRLSMHRIGMVAALMTGIAALTVAGRPAAAQEPGQTVIRGVVTDELTRAPIASAAILLLRVNGNTVSTTTTDGEGRFAVQVQQPGTYRLRAQSVGYRTTESANVEVRPGQVVNLDLAITPTPVMLDEILAVARSERRLRATEQLIFGRLVDDATREPIPQGTIQLLNERGQRVASATTTEQGLFRLVSPTPGTYYLRGDRLGYQSAETPELHLMIGDTIRLDFHLAVNAVLLSPITVVGTARPWGSRYAQPGMAEFYDRMARMGNRGEFLTRDSLATFERKNYTTSYMLRESTLAVKEAFNGNITLFRRADMAGCTPRYFVNGAEYVISGRFDDEFPIEQLEAIEVYQAPLIPGEYNGGFPCGVIVVWTRRSR